MFAMTAIFEIGINIRETHTRARACTHMHAQWQKTVDNGHRIILGLRRAVISDYVVRIRKKAFNSSLSKIPSYIISPYIVRIFPIANCIGPYFPTSSVFPRIRG